MRLPSILLAALFCLSALFLATGQSVSGSDDQRPLKNEAVRQTLEDLTKRVEKLEADKAVLEVKIKAQAKLLGQIYAWLRSVPEACAALEASVLEARKNGFEKAGPNPRAKRNVLEGLRSFADALNAKNPAKATIKGK